MLAGPGTLAAGSPTPPNPSGPGPGSASRRPARLPAPNRPPGVSSCPTTQSVARASFPLHVLPLSRCSARCTGATRAHARPVRGDRRGGDADVTFAPDSQPGSLGSNFDILVLDTCRVGPGRC